MVAMFVTRPRPKKDAMTAPPRKKRKADHAIDEINFDDTARADYLTGFHKRKVQRQKQAQDIAAEKARIERIAIRKEVREQRSKDVQEHVKQVNDALRAARLAGGEDVTDSEEDEDEWTGLDDEEQAKPAFVDHEEEYIDEDKYTTVTVEAVDIDREGMHALSGRHTSDSEASADESGEDGEGKKKKKKKEEEGAHDAKDGKDGKSKNKKEWPKKKKKKFRYENKLERQIARLNKKSKQSKR